MERSTIETSEGRFDVIFKHLSEMEGDGPQVEAVEAARRESEAIDELRRLSAEFAEATTVSYTST